MRLAERVQILDKCKNLVIGRRFHEKLDIAIGDVPVEITLIKRSNSGDYRLGIRAPECARIDRREVTEAKDREGRS